MHRIGDLRCRFFSRDTILKMMSMAEERQ